VALSYFVGVSFYKLLLRTFSMQNVIDWSTGGCGRFRGASGSCRRVHKPSLTDVVIYSKIDVNDVRRQMQGRAAGTAYVALNELGLICNIAIAVACTSLGDATVEVALWQRAGLTRLYDSCAWSATNVCIDRDRLRTSWCVGRVESIAQVLLGVGKLLTASVISRIGYALSASAGWHVLESNLAFGSQSFYTE